MQFKLHKNLIKKLLEFRVNAKALPEPFSKHGLIDENILSKSKEESLKEFPKELPKELIGQRNIFGQISIP